ncbi:MAG: hypothetical protein FJ096_03830, partial [Deltaproteobacteria bacterium]|nr:hypothetical protein [Deltaproteobacteria bacterium]
MLRLQLGAGIGTLVALGALALVPPGCSAAGDAKTLTSATSGGGGAGGDSEVASSGSGGSGGGGGAGGAGGAPAPCDPFDGAVLAIDELFVGGRTFAGETKPDAWEGFGFDLDDSNTVASFA